MQRDKMDNLIQDIINEDDKSINIPSSDVVWENINAKIKSKRRIEISYKIKVAIVAIFVITSVGTFVFQVQDKAVAVSKSILTFFVKSDKNSITINTLANDQNNKDSDINNQKILDLKNAKKELPLVFKLPDSLLYNYRLIEIQQLQRLKDYFEIMLTYSDGKKNLFIRQSNITGTSAASDNYNIDENLELIEINGYKGTIAHITNGTEIIKYSDENISYVFRANISAEQLTKIVKAFK